MKKNSLISVAFILLAYNAFAGSPGEILDLKKFDSVEVGSSCIKATIAPPPRTGLPDARKYVISQSIDFKKNGITVKSINTDNFWAFPGADFGDSLEKCEAKLKESTEANRRIYSRVGLFEDIEILRSEQDSLSQEVFTRTSDGYIRECIKSVLATTTKPGYTGSSGSYDSLFYFHPTTGENPQGLTIRKQKVNCSCP